MLCEAMSEECNQAFWDQKMLMNPSFPIIPQKSLTRDQILLKAEVQEFVEGAKTENLDNLLEIRRKKGTPLRYGNTFLLRNVYSGKYMKISPENVAIREPRYVV